MLWTILNVLTRQALNVLTESSNKHLWGVQRFQDSYKKLGPTYTGSCIPQRSATDTADGSIEQQSSQRWFMSGCQLMELNVTCQPLQ